MNDFSPQINEILRLDDVRLLEALPDLYITTSEGDSLLIAAIRSEARNCAQFLASDERIFAKISDSGETPLMTCVIFERFNWISGFLGHLGAKNEEGVTALMEAIEYGYRSEFEPLLAEAGIQDNDGMTALMLAAQDGLTQWFPLLACEAGTRDDDGLRAIDIARLRGVEISVEALLQMEP